MIWMQIDDVNRRMRSRWLWLVLPLLAGAVAYAPALWADLVWDDLTMPELLSRYFHTLGDVFRPPEKIPRWGYVYYRPLHTLSNLLDIYLFGTAARVGPHVASVLYHLAATLFVALLAHRWLAPRQGGRAAALFSATLFAVHPIHTESVIWIAGRPDVLATMFLLPALLLGLEWRDRGARSALGLSPACLLLALFSKEIALTGIVLMPLLWLAAPVRVAAGHQRAAGTLAAAAALAAGWLVAILLYAWLRAGAVSAVIFKEFSLGEALLRLESAAAWYVIKTVVPYPHSFIVTWDMVPGRLSGLAALALMAALTGLGIRLYLRRRDGLLLTAAAWFGVTISLALWLAVSVDTDVPLAERYLYLPSVAFVLAAGAALAAALAGGWRWPAAALASAITAAYLGGTLQRGLVWRSSLGVWADTATRVTDQGVVWEHLAWSHLRLGDEQRALEAFRRAAATQSYRREERARMYNMAGEILMKRRALAEADREYQMAVAIYPVFVEAWYGLAVVQEIRAEDFHRDGDRQRRDEAMDLAIHYYRTCLERFARYHPARLRLAAAYAGQARQLAGEGRDEEARMLFGKARSELDLLDRQLQRETRPGALERLIAKAGMDPDTLRRQLPDGP